MKTGLHQSTPLRQELKINPRLYQAMDLLYMPLLDLQQHLKQELLGQSVPRDGRARGRDRGPGRRGGRRREKEKAETAGDDEIDWEEILLDMASRRRPPRGARGARVLRAGPGGSEGPLRPSARPGAAARSHARASCSWPRSSSATSTKTATWAPRSRRSCAGSNELLEEHAVESEADLERAAVHAGGSRGDAGIIQTARSARRRRA